MAKWTYIVIDTRTEQAVSRSYSKPMTAKIPRNPSGLTLVEWLRAAGWGDYPIADVMTRDGGKTFEALAAGWTNDNDPAEWLVTAPKRVI